MGSSRNDRTAPLPAWRAHVRLGRNGKRVPGPAGAALLLLAAAACESPTEPPVQVIAPDSMRTLMVGESVTLTATVTNATNPSLVWRSAAPAIATVSSAGVVTGVSAGTTVVTAVSVQDTTKRADVPIVVVLPPKGQPLLPLPLVGHGQVSDRYTGEVAVRGDWAYTSTWGNRLGTPGNAINIWNVAGSTPSLARTLTVPGASTTGDVQISDDGALLVVAVEPNPNGAIVIYDRSDPSSPDSLARFSSANTRQGVHTVKLGRVAGRHYAFLSVNPGVNPPKLVVVDITDPANPVEVLAKVMGNPFLHDVFVRDGLLFTAEWDAGLGIWDIGGGTLGGTPAAPVLIGRIATISGNIHNIWWFHDPAGPKRYVFLGEEGPSSVPIAASGDLHVIDITDMANPVQVAQYNVPGAGAHNFWMDEASGVLYAAFYNGGVRALDVRGDLGSCDDSLRNARGFCDLRKMGRELAVGMAPNAFTWGVVHQGTRVYASDMVAGLHIFDASALVR